MSKIIFKDIDGISVGITDDKVINSGLLYGFSTRKGGVSTGSLYSLNLGVNRPDTKENLRENYNIFCSSVGVDPAELVVAKQVHSDIILEVSGDEKLGRIGGDSLPPCDGLITKDENVALGIFYADCTPVLLYDNAAKVLCLVHCGWRGTVKGFASAGVKKMVSEYGSRPENIHAVIGPCIGKCCFEVGTEVKEEFEKAGACKFISQKGEKFMVDLKGANRHFLLQAGVLEGNITVSEECTMCNTEKYFSHRGCGEDTGRMALIAKMK